MLGFWGFFWIFAEVDHFSEIMLFSCWTSANDVKVKFLKA